MKTEVSVEKLIKTFEDMANRESLLARGGISQQDLLMQITGTIVHVAMEDVKYTEALRKLFEVMDGRPDIKEVKFDRENDSFDVISDTGVHVCFGHEFRNR